MQWKLITEGSLALVEALEDYGFRWKGVRGEGWVYKVIWNLQEDADRRSVDIGRGYATTGAMVIMLRRAKPLHFAGRAPIFDPGDPSQFISPTDFLLPRKKEKTSRRSKYEFSVNFKVPQPICSTEDVLVMEYFDGNSLAELGGSKRLRAMDEVQVISVASYLLGVA